MAPHSSTLAWKLPWTEEPGNVKQLFICLFTICIPSSLNMPANLENSALATGLEKVSIHSNPKEKQCQRMLKLPHNCIHLTR